MAIQSPSNEQIQQTEQHSNQCKEQKLELEQDAVRYVDVDENVAKKMPEKDLTANANSEPSTIPPKSAQCDNVSIISLDDADSSIADSDSELEDLPIKSDIVLESMRNANNVNSNTSGIIVLNQNQQFDGNASTVSVPAKPSIGSIAVQNSTDITFGNKTFYQGPVTIKQFLLDNDKWKLKSENGVVNGAFDPSNDGGSVASSNKNTNDTTKLTNSNEIDTFTRRYCFSSKAFAAAVATTTMFIIVIAVLVSVTNLFTSHDNLPGDGDDSRINRPIFSTIDAEHSTSPPKENTTIPPEFENRFRIVSREKWRARAPIAELKDMKLPALRLIIGHTVTPNCFDENSCASRLRSIQNYHFNIDLDDIGYNFLIGGDGVAYEARGWNKIGEHTSGYNTGSICIAFIGDFRTKAPDSNQLLAAQLLIEDGVRKHKLTEGYRLYGQRQLQNTKSPGDALYEIIKRWPHWSADVFLFNA